MLALPKKFACPLALSIENNFGAVPDWVLSLNILCILIRGIISLIYEAYF